MHPLAAIDLNLLVALHALLEEANVTRAARRIGLSQPAMSHALARLRERLDDPLLVRAGRSMALTARAIALLGPVRATVDQATRLLAPPSFAPAELDVDLRLVTDDWIGTVDLPRVVAALSREAPRVNLDVVARGAPGRKAMLRRGLVDLALGAFSGAGMDLHRRVLRVDAWTTVLREGHPALDGPWTAEVFAGLVHLVVSPTGGRRGEVDTALQAVGLDRRVGLAVPHFRAALEVVAGSDLVATVPRSLAEAAEGVTRMEPPVSLPPLEVAMAWHARSEHDPVQRWFRELVEREVAR